MNKNKIESYSLASDSWGAEEIEAINSVIKSNRYTMGPKVKKFEEEFAQYFGTNYGIMVNSGSSANLLMIASLFLSNEYDLNKGDEVIVPAVSWSTTYYPVSQYGLKLYFFHCIVTEVFQNHMDYLINLQQKSLLFLDLLLL